MDKICGGHIIIIFTGDGKGKTSAALGTALRASGWGQRVAVIQFIKGNKQTGEWRAIQKIKQIDIFQFLDDSNLFIGYPTEKHRQSINNALKKSKEIITSGKYQLIVLDEINNALHHRLVSTEDIINLLNLNPKLDYILTGRDAPLSLIEKADLVSEIKKIKHPFDKKILAKKGIDY